MTDEWAGRTDARGGRVTDEWTGRTDARDGRVTDEWTGRTDAFIVADLGLSEIKLYLAVPVEGGY